MTEQGIAVDVETDSNWDRNRSPQFAQLLDRTQYNKTHRYVAPI